MSKLLTKIVTIGELMLRISLFTGSIILILYLIISYLTGINFNYFTPGTLPQFSNNVSLGIFKGYRNLFYVIYVFYLPLAIFAGIIKTIQKNICGLIIVCSSAAVILFLITFGFALAGLISDFIIFLILFNKNILKSQGV